MKHFVALVCLFSFFCCVPSVFAQQLLWSVYGTEIGEENNLRVSVLSKNLSDSIAVDAEIPSVETQRWSLGVKAGVNWIMVGGEDAQFSPGKFGFVPDLFNNLELTAEPQPLTTFAGGVYIGYAFSDLFSVQTEAMFLGKGVRYGRDFTVPFVGDSISGNIVVDAEASYVEIPLIAKFTIPIAGSMQPYLYGGMSLGIHTDKRTVVQVNTTFFSDSPFIERLRKSTPVTFSFYNLDWSTVAGGGARFRTGNTGFGLDIRYAMALNTAWELLGAELLCNTGEIDIKHHMLTLSGFMEFYF